MDTIIMVPKITLLPNDRTSDTKKNIFYSVPSIVSVKTLQ